MSGKIDRKLPAEPLSPAERRRAGSGWLDRGRLDRRGTQSRPKPMRTSTRLSRRCWRSAGTCSTAAGMGRCLRRPGGHSIVIARLAHRLQAAGWAVSVRALLTDCNTARKVARRPRELRQASGPAAARQLDGNSAERDEAAAEVLSVGYFTTLQVLFLVLLYSRPSGLHRPRCLRRDRRASS